MGKHRSRSPSPSSASDSSSERKHKHKKHKHKHKKDKSKKHKHSSADKERLEAAKAYLEQVLKQGGSDATAAAAAAAVMSAQQKVSAASADRGGDDSKRRQQRAPKPKPPNVGDIKEEDYFSRAPEFTSWLLEDRGTYFNSLSGDESRALFKDFVEDWNGGHLALKYYQGLVQAPTKRTTHQWGFGRKTGGAGGGAKGGVASLLEDQQQQRQEARQSAREVQVVERRKWRSDQKELLDELLPKASGREAQVEKRMARREAARAREDSPEMMRVTGGGDVMGGDDSFAAAKAREATYNARRNQRDAARREQLTQKLSAAQAGEDAKMAQFRALLAHGPISIPKRQ